MQATESKSDIKRVTINGVVFQEGKAPQKEKKCFRCKSDLVTKEMPAPAPYNRKIVCAGCETFVKWATIEIDDSTAAKIDDFFKRTMLTDKFYTSLFYQWSKKRNLSVKQIESLYRHPEFK